MMTEDKKQEDPPEFDARHVKPDQAQVETERRNDGAAGFRPAVRIPPFTKRNNPNRTMCD